MNERKELSDKLSLSQWQQHDKYVCGVSMALFDAGVSLYDFLFESSGHGMGSKNKESLEASQRIQDLGKKIEAAREQVKKLPGVDFTKEEQAAQLKALKKQLILKEELIQKYKHLGGDLSNFLHKENSTQNGHSE